MATYTNKLLANVAHDLRNPLNGIIMIIQYILNSNDFSQIIEKLQRILKISNSLKL